MALSSKLTEQQQIRYWLRSDQFRICLYSATKVGEWGEPFEGKYRGVKMPTLVDLINQLERAEDMLEKAEEKLKQRSKTE
jgi:hypothetical protein